MAKKSRKLITKEASVSSKWFHPERLMFVFTSLIHGGFTYLGYAITTRYIYDKQLPFVESRTTSTIPTEGNLLLFWGIILAAVISMIFTFAVWMLINKKQSGLLRPSFKKFLFANSLPIAAIIIAAYYTFDQLIGILLYTFVLALLIFFKDK